jgi:hypothetical protein
MQVNKHSSKESLAFAARASLLGRGIYDADLGISQLRSDRGSAAGLKVLIVRFGDLRGGFDDLDDVALADCGGIGFVEVSE